MKVKAPVVLTRLLSHALSVVEGMVEGRAFAAGVFFYCATHLTYTCTRMEWTFAKAPLLISRSVLFGKSDRIACFTNKRVRELTVSRHTGLGLLDKN